MKQLRYLRLSVTDACNQCCIYCRPAECFAGAGPAMSPGEIRSIVKILARAGVEKVRITGGEPLVREDLLEVVRAVASVPGIRCVGLTTNGSRLASCAHQLKQAGVTNINISLDSLDPRTYERITGTDGLAAALDGLHTALECGFDAVKTNTVVMNGINDSEVALIAALSRDLPIETRFIELMPLDGSILDWKSLFMSALDIQGRLGELEPVLSAKSSTAKAYRIPGARGRIGFIAPVTEPFCGNCDRIRLTCGGLLRPCLRLPDAYDMLRAACDPDAENIAGALLERCRIMKQQALSRIGAGVPSVSMSSIGG